MNRIVLRCAYVALLIVMFPFSLMAQEKELLYYDGHPSEILPDAQKSFKIGEYERTIQLCDWHYTIVGNKDADSLRDKAKRCAQLSTEMADYEAAGKLQEAKETAEKLLSINPDDVVAKELLDRLKEAEVSAPVDTIAVSVPEVIELEEQENAVPTKPVVDNPSLGQEENTISVSEITPAPEHRQVSKPAKESPRTRFLIKAGVAALDLKQFAQTIAPGGSLGVYDLGGSMFGLEAGFYLCPGLSALNASLFGVDASLVIRAAKGIYPKAGVGFLSCKSTLDSGGVTKGLCAGLGVTFFVGGNFCIEVGAKFFPKVSILDVEKVLTAGVRYEFPVTNEIVSGGIAPMVNLGWAF